jgi:hypothetical protein
MKFVILALGKVLKRRASVPDSKKNIEVALTELKKQKLRLDNDIRDLANAKAERARVMTAIGDLEHALKAVRGGSKPGPKPKKAARKPKAKKKTGPKRKAKAAKKTTKKKTNRSKAWTPAKRAAMRRKVKAYWAKKKKTKKVAKKATKSKPTKKVAKGWTPAKRKAASLRAKRMWAKKNKAG